MTRSLVRTAPTSIPTVPAERKHIQATVEDVVDTLRMDEYSESEILERLKKVEQQLRRVPPHLLPHLGDKVRERTMDLAGVSHAIERGARELLEVQWNADHPVDPQYGYPDSYAFRLASVAEIERAKTRYGFDRDKDRKQWVEEALMSWRTREDI